MKFGDKDYSLVPDRLKLFREENPRGSIETESTINPDGSVTFKATIIKDLANEYSARATGTARYSELEIKRPKAFEKLETISCGRALSNLGYLNDGRIASSEEMEEFEEYKSIKDRIAEAKSSEQLMRIFSRMTTGQKTEFTPMLSSRRKELEHATTV